MTKLLTSKPYESGTQHPHGLTQIRGVGAIKKQWLKLLGIKTIQDLAQSEIALLESQLRQKGYTLSRSEVESWVTQAQQLVAAIALNSIPSTAGLMHTESWETIAAFTVEFQTQTVSGNAVQRTIARNLKTDVVTTWTGNEIDQLAPWMRSEMNLAPAEAGIDELEQAAATAQPFVALEVTQLQIESFNWAAPIVLGTTYRPTAQPLKVGEAFTLEASLQLTQAAAYRIEQQLVYRAQCEVRNLSTGLTRQLGEVTANVPIGENSVYTVAFPEVSLPEAGAYRLKFLVTPEHSAALPSSFKVPMLQVI